LTGTGKTLAYLLPTLQQLDPEKNNVQAVVIAPTQELAMQIVRIAENLGSARGIRTLGLIGGASLKRQVERLRKQHPQLVAGTPGRLLELVEMRKLKLHQVRTIITDEVDQVFQLGEQQVVERLLMAAPRDRQLIFVSATVPDTLSAVIERWMNNPEHIDAAGQARTPASLEQDDFVC